MPNNAKTPAPASAPMMRDESWVVREMPIAPISRSGGINPPISVLRTDKSDGRTRPMMNAIPTTCSGVSTPVSAKIASVAASTA